MQGKIAVGTWLYPVLVLSGFFVFFIFRGLGVDPIVFQDEWLHSISARLTPIADVYSPSFAFYAVYRVTNSCGPAFLECARTLNVLLFLGSAILFYRLSLRYVDPRYALILLVVYLGVPSNVLVLLFTPDTMYYALFALFFVAVLLLEGAPGALAGGVLLGVMAIVKTNATFLLAGLLFFFLLEAWFEHKSWRRFLALSALAIVAFFVSRTVLAVALAGERGLSFTGTHYSDALAHALDLPSLVKKLPLLRYASFGHAMTIAILLGTFMACLFLSNRISPIDPRVRRLSIAMAGLFVPVLGATIIFSVLATEAGPYESIQRLSLRYYSFFFPFAYLYAFARLTHLRGDDTPSWRDRLPALAMLVLSGASLLLLQRFFTPLFNESPELWVLETGWPAFILVSLACLVPLAVLALRPSFAAPVYAGALLVMSATWMAASSPTLRAWKSTSVYDAAGRHAALFLGDQRSNLAVVGGDYASLYRAAFHVNAVGPEMVQVNRVLDEAAWAKIKSKPWTLLIGAEALRLAPAGTPAPSGFALVPTAALVQR